MKRILSYFWPVTTYIDSKYNGKLELTWMDGKKILDGPNSNYSYGSLQRILEYGLSQVYSDSISEILLLGLGGGCVIHSLEKDYNFTGNITAIEIDPTVIEIAKNEFNITSNKHLKIIESDAFDFVQTAKDKYDLIIIDLYIDNLVPEQFYSIDFWNAMIPLLSSDGIILFNAGIKLKNKNKINEIVAYFSTIVSFTKYEGVAGTNTVLIAQKRKKTI